MTPGKDVLKSIVNLEYNKDWRKVVEWLRKEHIKAAIDSTHIRGQEGDWVSGQAQFAEMVLDCIDTAADTMKKAEEEGEKPKGPIV
jgi:hypothetical protein